MLYKLTSTEEELNLRLQALDQAGKGSKDRFLDALEEAYQGRDSSAVKDAYRFACELEYDHVGLTPEAYLAHPLRVAEMTLSFLQPATDDQVIIALLHNVLEVGKCTSDNLSKNFGSDVSQAIVNLTVDRELQWDKEYKRGYYQTILEGPKAAIPVKAIDKFDNIFMLCLNPDEAIRKAYIEEIEEHILPMSQNFVPVIAELFKAATEEAKVKGHLIR